MTYLELCKRFHLELNAGAGENPGTVPTAVSGQTGLAARIVAWINQAWAEIQSSQRDWRWMIRTSSFNTVAGQQDYTVTATSQSAVAVTSITRSFTTATVTTTASHSFVTGQSITIAGAVETDYNGTFTITVTGAATFTYTVANSPTTPATGTITATLVDFEELRPYIAMHRRSYILGYLQSIGSTDQQPIWYLPWQDFVGFYTRPQILGNDQRPTFYSIKPDGKIALYPEPDAVYVVTFQYRKIVQPLVLATDIPEAPMKFHMVIVYRALSYYATQDNAQNARDQYGMLYRPQYQRMCNEQLPEPTVYGT